MQENSPTQTSTKEGLGVSADPSSHSNVLELYFYLQAGMLHQRIKLHLSCTINRPKTKDLLGLPELDFGELSYCGHSHFFSTFLFAAHTV